MTLSKPTFTIGVDEVGRGPIAGPVAVGAFVFLNEKAVKMFRGVKESKQLTETQREMWFEKMKRARMNGQVNFCVSFQSEKVIDGRGLSFAIRTALAASLVTLGIGSNNVRILLDGSLKAPGHYKDQKTIIRGDERRRVIALASICAKVLRDRKMNILSRKHPEYDFLNNKGYGTKKHYAAIEKFGVLPIHRKSFLSSIEV